MILTNSTSIIYEIVRQNKYLSDNNEDWCLKQFEYYDTKKDINALQINYLSKKQAKNNWYYCHSSTRIEIVVEKEIECKKWMILFYGKLSGVVF